MTTIGMDSRGVVRSASEFKDIFQETGESTGPYKCPFCEAPYNDEGITSDSRHAPYFELCNGWSHVLGCTGQPYSLQGDERYPDLTRIFALPGAIQVPSALVGRRKAFAFPSPWGSGEDVGLDGREVARRRDIAASDVSLTGVYSTVFVRHLVHAHRQLRKHVYCAAMEADLLQGSPEYDALYNRVLCLHPLSLYEHALNYATAFQGCRQCPAKVARVFYGTGRLHIFGDSLVLSDRDKWPGKPHDCFSLSPFRVTIRRPIEPQASEGQARLYAQWEATARADHVVEWYAYGTPQEQGDGFELVVSSVDHLYCYGQIGR